MVRMGLADAPRRGRALCMAIAALSLVLAFAVTSSAAADGVPFKPGDVLVGEGNGLIKHFDANGNLLDTLDTKTGSSEDTGMCFDEAGNLYTTNFEANNMSKFDKNGNLIASQFIPSSVFNEHPESCVFNSKDQMYVGQADGNAQVLEFDTTGKLLNSFSPARDARGTDWIDLAADQHTLHYTSEGTLVKQFDVGNNTQLPDFATGLPAPCYAHRILSDGGEIVACASEVVRLNTSGKIVQTYPVDPNQNLFALNIDPDGTSFWTADFNGDIWHVNIATGSVIKMFNAQPSNDVAGLAVVGELTVAADQKITASGTSVSATEGSPFSGTVATFSDPDSTAKPSDYAATVNWGDGTTTTGTISGSPTDFTVTGGHTYVEEGSNTITVTITDTDNPSNTATATSKATIVDAALHATGVTPSLSGRKASGTVATFTDSDPNGTLSDYSASIKWGDGSTTTGTVAKSGSHFAVSGKHTYAKSGKYTLTITIKDVGGSTATVTTTIASEVKAARVSAKLTSVPAACVASAFTAHVQGTRIASVRFTLDGAMKQSTTVHRHRQYSATIRVTPGRHTLTVKVTFEHGSAARFRTFRRAVTGCAPAPKFTG